MGGEGKVGQNWLGGREELHIKVQVDDARRMQQLQVLYRGYSKVRLGLHNAQCAECLHLLSDKQTPPSNEGTKEGFTEFFAI